MKKAWKLLLIILVVLIFGSFLYSFLFRPNPSLPSGTKVIVTTDKSNYKLNETVKITVKNNLNTSIWGFNGCVGPYWSLQRFENDQWKMINFSFPSKEEKCVFIACEKAVNKELKSNSKLEETWPLKRICEWPVSPIGVPKTEPKAIEKGLYRIVIRYSLIEEPGSQDNIINYSNEFRIN